MAHLLPPLLPLCLMPHSDAFQESASRTPTLSSVTLIATVAIKRRSRYSVVFTQLLRITNHFSVSLADPSRAFQTARQSKGDNTGRHLKTKKREKVHFLYGKVTVEKTVLFSLCIVGGHNNFGHNEPVDAGREGGGEESGEGRGLQFTGNTVETNRDRIFLY